MKMGRGTIISMVSLFVVVWMLVLACGGGGGGGESTVQPASQGTAAEAASMVFAAGELMFLSEEFNPQSADTADEASLKLTAWILEKVKEEILIQGGEYQAAGSGSSSNPCDISGSRSFSMVWDGPQTVSDACAEVSNVEVTWEFAACVNNTDSLDGTVMVEINGNFCSPTDMSFQFQNLDLTDDNENINFLTNNFALTYTNMDWNASDDMTQMTVTFNGDISAYSATESYDMTFSGFSISMSAMDTLSSSATISGTITGGCFNGPITYTTLSPVVDSDALDCPVSGDVQLSGAVNAAVSFNGDGSVDVDGVHFASCDDLPGTCE